MAKRKNPESAEESQDDGNVKSRKRANKNSSSKDSEDPFPGHLRPKEEECHAARDGLALLHGEPNTKADSGTSEYSILDSLVRTILSQNTTDTNSSRTFANLKEQFGEWEDVRLAHPAKVEAAIKLGGLAAVKTERIKDILNSVKEEQGSCTLEHLRKLGDEEIKKTLLQYKGVGPKTAACVLMFSLGRHEFPVDTHVWRIAKNLGWVPKTASREETYAHLNTRIPDEIKFALHVLMVEHGKRCERCAKNGKPRKESHGPCPLVNLAHAATYRKTLDAKSAAEAAETTLKEEDIVKDESVKSEEQDGTEGVKQEEEGSDVDQEVTERTSTPEVKAEQNDEHPHGEFKQEEAVEQTPRSGRITRSGRGHSSRSVKVKNEPAS